MTSNGVSPSAFHAPESAPASISVATAAAWSMNAATYSGVKPLSVRASGSALARRQARTSSAPAVAKKPPLFQFTHWGCARAADSVRHAVRPGAMTSRPPGSSNRSGRPGGAGPEATMPGRRRRRGRSWADYLDIAVDIQFRPNPVGCQNLRFFQNGQCQTGAVSQR